MNIDDIDIPDIVDIPIKSIHVGGFAGFPLMTVAKTRKAGDDLVSIEIAGQRIVAEPSGKESNAMFSRLCSDKRVLAAIVVHDDTCAVMRLWSFTRSYELLDKTISIHLGDDLLRSIATLVGSSVDDESVQNWLKDEFLISTDDPVLNRLILRVHPGQEILVSGFVLVGRQRELDIRIVDGAPYAVRIAPRRPESFLSTVLLLSKIRFTNELLSEETDDSPSFSFLESNGYLKMWDRYGEAELSEEEERGSALGEGHYSSREDLNDGTWRFVIHSSPNFLTQITTDMTLDIHDPGLGPRKLFSGDVSAKDMKRFTVDVRPTSSAIDPPTNGILTYALGGSTAIQKRRKIAFHKIATGKSEIPELAAVLEMKSSPPRKIDRALTWDSPAVRAIFRGSEPTEAQKRAIEVALNTPDIAIIQGPPGTGKTQVISAIAVRVAEEMKNTSATRQVLLSSFQHEAVDNAASRTMVFGLPTVKESAGDSGRSWLKVWRFDRLRLARELFERQEQGTLSLRRNEIVEMRAAYLLSPIADTSAGEMLEDLSHGIGESISAPLHEELLQLASKLRRSRISSEKNLRMIASIRSIRTTQDSFMDDGKINASRALARLGKEFAKADGIDLNSLEAAQNEQVLNDEQLQKLEQTKNALLDRLGASRIHTLLPSRNDKVVEILNKLIHEIDAALKIDGKGLSLVLTRFIHDLEADAYGVENCLGGYAAVVAATCQGAGALAARPEATDHNLAFNTVIIDEAARANPLDLQIPMSIASQRVILVGDQRQLPHIVDQRIAGSIVSGDQELVELEESLFGRLFRFLESERRAGRPNRVVTLNKQFRMHPDLGDFVSKNFYEMYGESIESPRPTSDFAHDINGYKDRFAAWIDVPISKGSESKSGTSRIREAEAKTIADEAKRILESDSTITLGVITFYRAQAELILDYLMEIGVADRDPETGVVGIFSDQWKFTTNKSGDPVERLRVDTVDAFQGKEFDVSMLSTVRTPGKNIAVADRAFGHLRIMNRLCVALSRQRKLLIVVGDRKSLVEHPLANTHIKPLCAFSEMCTK